MISILFLDVDGTLTDGKIYMGEKGELFKAFCIKDGYGINTILRDNGITPVVLTSRNSPILANRLEELGVNRFYQGVKDKKAKMMEVVREYGRMEDSTIELFNVAYIGDDLGDYQCMKTIGEAGGIVGCPADAAKAIKEISHYICGVKGGEGAVREFIEWLIEE